MEKHKNQLNVFLCLQGTIFYILYFHHMSVEWCVCMWWGGGGIGSRKPSSSNNNLTNAEPNPQLLEVNRHLCSGQTTQLHTAVS